MNGPDEKFEDEKLESQTEATEPVVSMPIALRDTELAAWEITLTQALRPVEPPAGFAERVLRRASLVADAEAASSLQTVVTGARLEGGRRPAAKLLAWPRARAWVAGVAAAALVVGVFIEQGTYKRREHARVAAERRLFANQEFEASLRITDTTMERMRGRLRRAGVTGI